jgi:Mn2+/Fe2+ NRAMP family transporter
MQRLLAVLFWSVIAAAFIGPGTVTTCASSGAGYRYTLLWALLFSAVACFVLQEASARVTACSGRTLAEAIRMRARTAAARWAAVFLILGAILVGCAAYEAGNILGAVSGAALAGIESTAWTTIVLVGAAFSLLWFGSAAHVARILGAMVAVMAVAFLVTAVRLGPDPGELVRGLMLPSIPAGAGILVLGLVGTTVVPYNLFLGSGLAAGQGLREIRFGLAVAVGLGAVVSMAILVVGTAISGSFSFDGLADTLTTRLGGWARHLFAAGLLAAGFSSAVTAPFAAALTARGLFGSGSPERWSDRSWRYRTVWAIVLLTGLFSGLSGFRPVPVILLVQALNGVLLPLVAVFLLLVVNDRKVMGLDGANGAFANAAIGFCTLVTMVLGVSRILGAVAAALPIDRPTEATLLAVSAGLSAVLAVPVGISLSRSRR